MDNQQKILKIQKLSLWSLFFWALINRVITVETGVGLQNLFLLFVDKHHEKCNKQKRWTYEDRFLMKAFDDEVSEDCSDYKAEDNAVENKGVVECFTVMGSQKAVQILGSVS